MTEFIPTLLSITKGAFLTAGLIILLRLLLRKVLSAKAKYYLWLLLALRLMLPALPESSLSLMNLIPETEPAALQVEIQEPAAEAMLPSIQVAEPIASPAAAALPAAVPAAVAAAITEAEAKPALSTDTLILLIWAGGMAAVLLGYLMLYALTARRLRQLPECRDSETISLFQSLKRELGIHRDLRLTMGGGGMLGGLGRPTIVLPAECYGQAAAPILLHELLHYKYKDLLIYLLFRLLTAIYWFNPLVWLCFHQARQDSEAACDQRVMDSGLVCTLAYAQTLYREGILNRRDRILMQTSFGGSGHNLKRRISAIAGYTGKHLWVTILALVLALVICACTLTEKTSGTANTTESTASEASQFYGQIPEDMDIDSYIQALQPEFGHFGWTFAQHTEAGLLSEENGQWEETSEMESIFLTELNVDGEMLEARYIFSITQFTRNTTNKQVLTEILLEVPNDVTDVNAWSTKQMAPWDGLITQNSPESPWRSSVCVGAYLSEGETAALCQNMLRDGYVNTKDAALNTIETWYFFLGQYLATRNAWQFNGTGIALYLTRGDADLGDWIFSPYQINGDTILYGNTNWGMTEEEVYAAEAQAALDSEGAGTSQITDCPIPNHLEVKDIQYTFYGKENILGSVIVHYDPRLVTYEQLVAQRTKELGDPTYAGSEQTRWETATASLTILNTTGSTITEQLTSSQHESSVIPESAVLSLSASGGNGTTTEFTTADLILYSLEASYEVTAGSKQVEITCIIRDSENTPVLTYTSSSAFDGTWSAVTHAGTLPEMPQEAGDYTLAVYFDGQLIAEAPFHVRLATEEDTFFALFHELERDSMLEYVESHPDVLKNGWNGIDINESGLSKSGTGIMTTNGHEVLAIDAANGILLLRVVFGNSRGVMAITKDSTRLLNAAASTLGSKGQTVGDICEEAGGILAINGSAFQDDGDSTGGQLSGLAVCNGTAIGESLGSNYKRLELRDDGMMYIVDAADRLAENTLNACEFKPALIVDGQILVDETCGWTSPSPRTAIGQSFRLEGMMVVMEGRLADSPGCGVVEIAELMKQYGCVQAINLDGGTSSMMYYKGQYITRCSNTALPSGRQVPTAWIYR